MQYKVLLSEAIFFFIKRMYVSWMGNLTELDASWSCGIDQNGIKNLDLNKLSAEGNHKINTKN